jgi:hypothetical protein
MGPLRKGRPFSFSLLTGKILLLYRQAIDTDRFQPLAQGISGRANREFRNALQGLGRDLSVSRSSP